MDSNFLLLDALDRIHMGIEALVWIGAIHALIQLGIFIHNVRTRRSH